LLHPKLVRARLVTIHAGLAVGLTLSAMAATLGISPQHASRLGLRTLAVGEPELVHVVAMRVEREMSALLRSDEPLLSGKV
jgi:hypothetical protein